MKKIKSFAIFIFILCFVFCNKEIFAQTNGNWEYYIENNLAIIVGYSGNDSNVTIPSNLDGYVVNQIGYESVEEQAYYVPFERNENIETVTIPDTVKKIEKATFYYCPNLKTVNIPNSVKEIDSEFVYGTKNVNYTINLYQQNNAHVVVTNRIKTNLIKSNTTRIVNTINSII